MNHQFAPNVIEALHRIDGLARPAPAAPQSLVAIPPAGRSPRKLMVSVAAAVLLVGVATVAVVGQWNSDTAEARFGVVQAGEGVPWFLPVVVPDGYVLSGAERLPADPAERGNSVLTGRVSGDVVTDWVSAWSSSQGVLRWIDAADVEQVATDVRSYRLADLDGELVADFEDPACGAVLVTTASRTRTEVLSAADRVRCTDDGSLVAEPLPGTELLYTGPRNTATDDGLLLTYSGSQSDTVTVHLRRFGFPPELVGLRFDGEANREPLGDKQVSITDTPGGRSIGWSFAPDNLIVVSGTNTTPDGVVEEFVRALEQVSASELETACASISAKCQ